MASDLPTEGRAASAVRAGRAARRDVRRYQLSDPVVDGEAPCAVVNEQSVLLGVLETNRIEPGNAGRAAELMNPAPPTIRPNSSLESVAKRLRESETRREAIWVTTPDGELIGVVTQTEPQPPGAAASDSTESSQPFDIVDEASAESMPASDPPAWTTGRPSRG